MIDFSRAFNAAWERMVFILFQPFDLGKWFVIGFSAFLAGLMDGGNGFSGNGGGSGHGSEQPHQLQFQHPFSAVSSYFSALQFGTMISIVSAIVVLALALAVALYWLGARGQFLFLDNIVRNRGEIALPWKIYARQGNRVFVFHLICMAAGFGLLLIVGVPGALLFIFGILHQPHVGPFVFMGMAGLGMLYLLVAVAFALFLFLFREWAIPLMFRYDITVGTALREIGALVSRYPGATALFVLLRIALLVALIVVAIMACFIFCCLELIPYLGTVILLPALIFIRCFSLECLAQFGPQYNIWFTDQPNANAVTPQPPLG